MFFWKRKKKSEQQSNAEEVEQDLEQEEIEPLYKSDCIRYVRDVCESVAENEKQLTDSKNEYEYVTEYLTDIQKIDRIEDEDKKALTDAAQSIYYLQQDRKKFKNRQLTITEAQVRKFDMYDTDELEDQVKKMYAAQEYQQAIEGDLNNLKAEKKKLLMQRKEIVEKQYSLKKLTIVLTVMMISIMALLIVLYYMVNKSMQIPYIITIAFIAVFATIIFAEATKNRRDCILTERKLNKAVGLLNRVKIKYVNNISVLEYDRSKYGVKDAAEFEKMLKDYYTEKEYERKFRENTSKLEENNAKLLSMLEKYQVREPSIWLTQPQAIFKEMDMFDIRHELNNQRAILRKRIEYNKATEEKLTDDIISMITKHDELKDDFIKIIMYYNNTLHIFQKKGIIN